MGAYAIELLLQGTAAVASVFRTKNWFTMTSSTRLKT
jgi:hypothetical protein